MDERKIQKTGGSSYTITLPKNWIKKNKLKNQDLVSINEKPGGGLQLNPGKTTHLKTKIIEIREHTDPQLLFRMLIGSYVVGYKQISIKSKNKITLRHRETVAEFTKTAIGPEIISEEECQIILKDLLDPAEIPIESSILRMRKLVNTMHEDSVIAFTTNNTELGEKVVSEDQEMNRLHWLISHQYKLLEENTALSEKLAINLEDARFHMQVSAIMERIADHSVAISRAIPEKVPRELVKKIFQASNNGLRVFNESMDSFTEKDAEKADKAIKKIKKHRILADSITEKPLNDKKANQSLMRLAESIRRTGEYSANICEYAIDAAMLAK